MPLQDFLFLFKTTSNREFSSLCSKVNTDLSALENALKLMPQKDLYALQFYAENIGSNGATMWIKAEIQRREFITLRISIWLSIAAIIISMIALLAPK